MIPKIKIDKRVWQLGFNIFYWNFLWFVTLFLIGIAGYCFIASLLSICQINILIGGSNVFQGIFFVISIVVMMMLINLLMWITKREHETEQQLCNYADKQKRGDGEHEK